MNVISPKTQDSTVFLELTPSDTLLLEQAASNERVHTQGAESVEALLQYRIAGPGYAKTAFAIASPDKEKLHAVIYGQKSFIRKPHLKHLPGDVSVILNQCAKTPLTQIPNTLVCYSISAMTKGAGVALVQNLLASAGALLPATLSPLRSLNAAFGNLSKEKLTDEENQVLATLHLMTGQDPVQIFHMGRNGARVGKINTNANTPESADGVDGRGVMVNYIYDATQDTRECLKTRFDLALQKPSVMLDLFNPQLLVYLRDNAQGMPDAFKRRLTSEQRAKFTSLAYA